MSPLSQALSGALVLILCVVWPPMILVFVAVAAARFIAGARHGSKRRLIAAWSLLAGLSLGSVYFLQSPLVWLTALVAVGTGAWWLLSARAKREVGGPEPDGRP